MAAPDGLPPEPNHSHNKLDTLRKLMASRDGSRPETFRSDGKGDGLRVPPFSVESEQSVLGGLMIDNSRLDAVRPVLAETDFYRRDHRLIYRAMIELAEKKSPIDAVTLGEWFEANNLAEQIGGSGYLVSLASDTPSAANIHAYAKIVREKSTLRRLIELGTEIVNDGFRPEGRESSEVLSQACARLTTLSDTATAGRSLADVDLGALAESHSDAPRFVLDPYVPRGVVTLLGAHGGAGKSILALIMAAHVAAGRSWAGRDVAPGRAVFVSLEDPGSLVLYRLQRIIEAYQLRSSVVTEHLTVVDGTAGEAALATERADAGVRRLEPSKAFAELQRIAVGADLVVIDNASDGFDGDEINRRQVRAFVRMLSGMARANDAGVLLLAHIDKTAARYGSAGNSYSGSTAWHNSVRSRLALVEADGAVELRQEKLNLGKPAAALRLSWSEHGVLLPEDAGAAPTPDRSEDDALAVLAALRAAAANRSEVSAGRTGPGNTHLVLSTFPELPARLKQAKGKDAFWAALARLQSTRRVEVVDIPNAYRKIRRCFVEVGSAPDIARATTPTPPGAKTGATRADARAGSDLLQFPELAQTGATSAADEYLRHSEGSS